MAEMLTTKQLQEILQVDRTTIYRMADSGRIPGMKVGNQWRFPRHQIEDWLQKRSGTLPIWGEDGNQHILANGQIETGDLLPLACVQLIQDSFADILEVMMLVTDMEGNLITDVSNPCGLFSAAQASDEAHKRCIETWSQLAQDPTLMPRFRPSPLGLLCARGLIRVGNEIKAMLVVGGIAPSNWPPNQEGMSTIARDSGLSLSQVRAHVHEVHSLTEVEQARVLPFVQRVADIFSHIADERHELFSRLKRIAEITQM